MKIMAGDTRAVMLDGVPFDFSYFNVRALNTEKNGGEWLVTVTAAALGVGDLTFQGTCPNWIPCTWVHSATLGAASAFASMQDHSKTNWRSVMRLALQEVAQEDGQVPF